MNGNVSEAEVTMVLDTYMYLNYEYAEDGQTLRELVEEMPSLIDVEEEYFNEYSVVSKASRNPQIGELQICCQARDMGYNEGTNAVTFTSPDQSKVYVIYRGTADGEWMDNGLGMTESITGQQQQAVDYFDEVVQKLEISDEQEVYLGAHSKGGNKIQFVTMESSNADKIDACYSVDGQGHSDAAIKRWKEMYTPEEYKSRVEKIYAINGQNDFVSVLGYQIIPAANVCFVETPAGLTDFAGYHDITRMFATRSVDENGKETLAFKGTKNKNVLNRGELGNYVADMSEGIMSLPGRVREGSAATMMQLVEIVNKGKMTGLNKEHMTALDFAKFFNSGLPLIIQTLVVDPEGKELVKTMFNKEAFSMKTSELSDLEVDYEALRYSSVKLKSISEKIDEIINKISEIAITIPLIFDGMVYSRPHMEQSLVELGIIRMKYARLAAVQEKVAEIYGAFDMKAGLSGL